MKKIFLLVGICAIAVVACNNTESNTADVESVMKDSSKFTTIQWIDTSIDFGSKKMGDMVSIVFRCKNTGDKPLYLYQVHPGCGCTVADYTKTPIAPGAMGQVNAQFDTKKSHPGEVHKTIYVSANNSNPVNNYLKFSGMVLPADSTQSSK
jgi:uncharacterized protein DUF1573